MANINITAVLKGMKFKPNKDGGPPEVELVFTADYSAEILRLCPRVHEEFEVSCASRQLELANVGRG